MDTSAVIQLVEGLSNRPMAMLKVSSSDLDASQPLPTSYRPNAQSSTAQTSSLNCSLLGYSSMNKHHCLLICATTLSNLEG